MTDADEPDLDDDTFRCWCDEEGPFEDLCDTDTLDRTCGGTGELHCYCGGDFCVCHNHGSAPCPGCEDCEPDDRDDYDHGGES